LPRRSRAARLAPGQYLTQDFPVLSAGPTPHQPLDAWTFEIRGKVDEPKSWTWQQFQALPRERITVDIHCVTKWSKFDTTWTGVSIDTLLEGVETSAEYVLAFCDGGYSTNLPLEDVRGGKAWVAYQYDDKPLDPVHGGPARLLVPHHFWRARSGCAGSSQCRGHPGSGAPGYHNHGDHGKNSGTPTTDVAGRTRRRRRGGRARPAWSSARRLAGHRAASVDMAHRRGRLPDPTQLLVVAPRTHLVLTVRRLDDGGFTPYGGTVQPGDELELRGPVGGYFVWEGVARWPLVLVGGGSGVVPLRAMLRHHRAVGSDLPARLLYSARTQADLIYQRELSGFDTTMTLTREHWAGRTGRVDRELLEEVAWPATDHPLVYVCGPTGFVEAVTTALVALGHDPSRVRTERFGPT
jgi:hypothetical protein